MTQSFLFGGKKKPLTYEEMMRQRAVSQSLAQPMPTRNLGEGLSGIGRAIGSKMAGSRADKASTALRGDFEKEFQALLGGNMGGSAIQRAVQQRYSPQPTQQQPQESAPLAAGDSRIFDRSIPRSIRTNNPGAINFKKWQSDFPGFVGTTKDDGEGNVTSAWETPEHGVAAWEHLIDGVYGAGGRPMTVSQIADRYAGGDGSKYVAAWTKSGELSPDTVIDPENNEQMLALAKGTFGFESDQAQHLSDEQILAGLNMDQQGEQQSVQPQARPQQAAQMQPASYMAQSQQNSGIDPRLALMMGNPMATPGQKAIMQAMLQRQMSANAPMDPFKQLQMQKMQMEMDKMQNPQIAADRKILKGADGFYRYADNGDRVFPGVEQSPEATVTEYGLVPQTGVDKDGNPVLLQLGKDGRAVQTAMPDDVTLSNQPIRLDAGTHFVLLDPVTRNVVGKIKKDLAGVEAQKIEGKAQAEARIDFPRVAANAEESIKVIEQALAHPGLAGSVGLIQGRLGAVTEKSADFLGYHNQIVGKTFLEAYETLKGSGQITEDEGKKAESAVARLSRVQSEEAYRAALTDLMEVIKAGAARARQEAGGGVVPAPNTTLTPELKAAIGGLYGPKPTGSAPSGVTDEDWEFMTPEERSLFQ